MHITAEEREICGDDGRRMTASDKATSRGSTPQARCVYFLAAARAVGRDL